MQENVISFSEVTKKCSKCLCVKPLSDFHLEKEGRHGRRASCAKCNCLIKSAYYHKNKEYFQGLRKQSYTPEKGKHNHLKHTYNISLGDYNKLFDAQYGKCKTCGIHQSVLKKSLCVDHCHITGKIRGLLCNDCNISIGRLKENITTLKNIIEYLNAK